MYKYNDKDVLRIYRGGTLLYERVAETLVEPMLVTPAAIDVIITSASDLEIDWGDGTIQTVKSGDDYLYEMFGLISNQYVHTYTDSYEDKVISIKHLDGKSPIQFLSTIFFKTVERWYSEGYQPFRMFNEQYGIDREMAFYGLGKLLETVPNIPPPKTVHLSGMFSDSNTFNQDISGWDVSNVTDMTGMFYNAKAFNQDLSNWCVTNITSEPDQFAVGSPLAAEHKPVWGTCPSGEDDSDGETVEMGLRADYSGTGWYKATDTGTVFSKGVPALETHVFSDSPVEYVSVYTKEDAILYGERAAVSNMTDMNNLFDGATEFNKDISSWDVSNVVSMEYMFRGASSFNQDISNWDTSNVTNMSGMFRNALAFNQDISSWNVSKVTRMISMFNGTSVFNQDIGTWDVSNVTEMFNMFRNTSAFNQDISEWDVSNVTHMSNMFQDAISFNQDLSNWCVSKITSLPASFDQGATSWVKPKPVWGTCPRGENVLTT